MIHLIFEEDLLRFEQEMLRFSEYELRFGLESKSVAAVKHCLAVDLGDCFPRRLQAAAASCSSQIRPTKGACVPDPVLVGLLLARGKRGV